MLFFSPSIWVHFFITRFHCIESAYNFFPLASPYFSWMLDGTRFDSLTYYMLCVNLIMNKRNTNIAFGQPHVSLHIICVCVTQWAMDTTCDLMFLPFAAGRWLSLSLHIHQKLCFDRVRFVFCRNICCLCANETHSYQISIEATTVFWSIFPRFVFDNPQIILQRHKIIAERRLVFVGKIPK